MPFRRRALVAYTLILFIPFVILGCLRPAVSQDGTASRVLSGSVLGLAWLDIQKDLKIAPGTALTRQLSFTLFPDAGETGENQIRSLEMQFIIPGSNGTTLYTVRREVGENTYHTGAQPYPRGLDQQVYIPVDDLVLEIDGLGQDALALKAGEYTAVDLVLKVEEGRLFGLDPYDHEYLVGEQGFRRIAEPDLVAVDGRTVAVRATAVGAKLSEDQGRLYVLAGLCGEVHEDVQVPKPLLGLQEEWLDTRWADLDGYGPLEQVYLLGTRSTPELPFPDRKSLLIGGEDGIRLDVPGDGGIYGSEFRLQDLTGDGRPEYLFFEHMGGSGAIINLNVYSLKDGRLRPIFRAEDHSEIPGMHREYLGDDRVRVAIDPLGVVWEYDVAFSNYRDNPELTEEQIKEDYGTNWLDSFSDYDIEDINGDGRPEIIGHQMVCGVAHADVIGLLSQIFCCNEKGEFRRSGVEFYQETAGGPLYIQSLEG